MIIPILHMRKPRLREDTASRRGCCVGYVQETCKWPARVLLFCDDAVSRVKLAAMLPVRAGAQHKPHALQKRDHKRALQAGAGSNLARETGSQRRSLQWQEGLRGIQI